MKVLLAAVVVVVALAASACGSSAGVATPDATAGSTPLVTVHGLSPAKLPLAVRKAVEHAIRAAKHPSRDATVGTIEVYGPATRTELNAVSGGGPVVTPPERKEYYLTVLLGHFVCDSCSRPAGAAAPRGSVETSEWSPTAVGDDFGLMRKLPRTVARLHRLIRIRISYAGRL
jgi:hypothetical protein